MAAQKSEKADVFVSKTALRILKLADLNTDPSYQRGVVVKHKRIVSEFDEDALGVMLVGQREDGSLWVVDGLQRVTALKKLGWFEARFNVFRSNGPEHEAQVFKLVNKNRTSLTATQLFHALLTAGDEECWAVKRVAESLGYKLPTGGKRAVSQDREQAARELTCLNSLVRIYHHRGEELLRFVLSTVKDCWPGDPYGVKADIVDGLATWWVARKAGGREFDRDRLVSRLRQKTAHQIIMSAVQGSFGRAQNVANVIDGHYERRTRRKNPE
jgi:hypothetical protein